MGCNRFLAKLSLVGGSLVASCGWPESSIIAEISSSTAGCHVAAGKWEEPDGVSVSDH